MMKKYLLMAAASLAIAPYVGAQTQVNPCATDEMHKLMVEKHPEILELEAQFAKQIKEGISRIDLSTAAKTTFVDQSGNDDFWYDIPIVVHVVHDFNTYNTSTFIGDFIPDNFIYEAVKDWNIVFAKKNADTADVIQPFKKWIGNPHIRLHLATVDPYGNQTKGITRTRSYLTYTAGDQAKFNDWPNTSYINLWFINKMSSDHSNAAAYAYKPPTGAVIPFYDGVIALAGYMNNGSKTLPHELGHSLNLDHPWGGTNQPAVACGDDDVDDTPPTKGHNTTGCTAASLYDGECCVNYFKIYTDTLGNIELVDYPDTANSQNLMDYTYCDKMFTKGQAKRMHFALNSEIAGRNNLWDSANLVATGALAPIPDLKPTPEFSITQVLNTSYLSKNANFTFPGRSVKFTNFSYNDTVVAVNWTMTNGSTTVTETSTTNFTQSFTAPGWYSVKMEVEGNHSGVATKTWEKAFYVADETATDVTTGYMQEFSADGDNDKWPIFNYYNNDFKWEISNVGTYDNSGIKYNGYDARVTPFTRPYTGSPAGDFDDFFSIPVNLTPYASSCNLVFNYSGATRTSASAGINDSLYIDYSVNKGTTWAPLAKLGKAQIFNKGALSTPYTPTSVSDWETMHIKLPNAAITDYTTFRFRYMPGVGVDGVISSGNNFYMDRVHFSPWGVGVNDVANGNSNVLVVPNPTHGSANIIVRNILNSNVKVTVSDITGKVVYTTEAASQGSEAQIVVPAAAISAKGMYLVQVLTGNQVSTQKLVVY